MSITITTGHGHNGVPVRIEILRCSCSMLMFIFMSRVGFELYYMAFFHMTATLYLTALALQCGPGP